MDAALQVRRPEPGLEGPFGVAVDRERVDENLRVAVEAHVEQELDQFRRRGAVLAGEAGAVDLRELLKARVLREELADRRDAVLGAPLALRLPREGAEDH